MTASHQQTLESKQAGDALRNQSEESFRHNEDQLWDIFNQTTAGIAQVDLTGRFMLVNRRFCDITGYSADELRHKTCAGITHPDDRACSDSMFLQAMQERKSFVIEKRYVRPDGSHVWVHNSVSEIVDGEGRLKHMLAVCLDINAQKRIEGALQEADRRKDEFLATLAHELRNPLAPIRNGLQVMKLAGDNAAVVEQSRTMIERQVSQLVRLVDDLLDVSRISQGKIELRKERVELAAVVHLALEMCESVVKEHGHELTVTLPDEPVQVDADKARMAQALCNLLNNAAKYTNRGGHIWLTVQRQGSEAILSVSDTGIGIPAAMLSKVFDLFTQVDRSLEKSQSGLGIGLTLVKRLVELHGGRVEARSDGPGLGSEFLIRLPMVLHPAGQEQTEHNGQPAGPTARRVLVVDDNADAADSLALLLQFMGNEVRTARDGLEGVATAAAFRPDVALVDIGMPKLNGYETCQRIRQEPWGRAIHLVALTGWGQDEDKRRAQVAGFNDHLVKPVDLATLEKLLAGLRKEL